MGPPLVQEKAARALLPGPHLLDSGYGDAEFLGTAQQPQIDVVGPPCGSYRGQPKIAHGYDFQVFILDWEAPQAHGPQGHTSVKWTPGHAVSGAPVLRSRFDQATCRACPTRQGCTAAKDAPRPLTVRPQAYPEALQAARQRQEPPAFKERYALRSGVERSLSQGIRRFALRQSRSRGGALDTTPAVEGVEPWGEPPGRALGGQCLLEAPTLFPVASQGTDCLYCRVRHRL